jgi:hypothetical protein
MFASRKILMTDHLSPLSAWVTPVSTTPQELPLACSCSCSVARPQSNYSRLPSVLVAPWIPFYKCAGSPTYPLKSFRHLGFMRSMRSLAAQPLGKKNPCGRFSTGKLCDRFTGLKYICSAKSTAPTSPKELTVFSLN